MANQYAIDIATARPTAAQIKASGYTAVVGYFSGGLLLGGQPKDMPAKYEEELLSTGLGTGRVWETSAQAALGGATQGKTDGEACLAEAQAFGYPPGAPLWVNVGDFAATPAQIPAITAYYNAFFKACPGYEQGGYATAYIIDQLVKAGCKGTWWQNAMDDQGEAGSVLSANASMYQRVTPTRKPPIPGGGYDEDVYGFGPAPVAWRTSSPPPFPAPQPTAHGEYKLTLEWAAVPGAAAYQYQVEQRQLFTWRVLVADATTSATSVVVPVPARGGYRYRMCTGATVARHASPWTAWAGITI